MLIAVFSIFLLFLVAAAFAFNAFGWLGLTLVLGVVYLLNRFVPTVFAMTLDRAAATVLHEGADALEGATVELLSCHAIEPQWQKLRDRIAATSVDNHQVGEASAAEEQWRRRRSRENWWEVVVYVTPQSPEGTADFQAPWDPSLVVPFVSPRPGEFNLDDPNTVLCEGLDTQVFQDDRWINAEATTVRGTARIRLRLAAPPSAGEFQLLYMFRQPFGRVRLQPTDQPLAAATEVA